MSDGLMQLLDPEAIVLGSDASTNEEIIRILAGRLEALGYVKSSYADAVVRRTRVSGSSCSGLFRSP